LLHDTIEDAGVSHEELTGEFGIKVADGALALTKDKNVGADQQDKWEGKKLPVESHFKKLIFIIIEHGGWRQ